MSYKTGNQAPVSLKLYRFKELSKLIKPFFKLENIELNFAGYENTLSEFSSVDYGDLPQVFELNKNLLLWVDYLEELRCVVHTCIMKLDNREAYLDAFLVNNSTKQIKDMVAETLSNKKMCAHYEKELLIQIKFLNLAYKHVAREYNEHIHNGL